MEVVDKLKQNKYIYIFTKSVSKKHLYVGQLILQQSQIILVLQQPDPRTWVILQSTSMQMVNHDHDPSDLMVMNTGFEFSDHQLEHLNQLIIQMLNFVVVELFFPSSKIYYTSLSISIGGFTTQSNIIDKA